MSSEGDGLGGDDILGVQVKVLFGITVAVVIIAQLFTLCSVKERGHLTNQDPFIVHKESSSVIKLVQIDHSRDDQNSPDIKDIVAVSAEITDNTNGGATNEFSEPYSSDQSLPLLNEENAEQHDLDVVSCEDKPNLWFKEIVGSIYGTFLFVKYMSFTFLRLCILVCFSWFAYLAVNIFFTTFVGEVVYGGSPISGDKELRDNFDEGVITGSAGLAVQSFTALVYSLASEWITRCFGLRPVVIGVHMAYLVTCGVTVLYPTVLTAMVVNVVSGVYFALLVNFPYALIPYYKVSS